jgi:hypothetical protein
VLAAYSQSSATLLRELTMAASGWSELNHPCTSGHPSMTRETQWKRIARAPRRLIKHTKNRPPDRHSEAAWANARELHDAFLALQHASSKKMLPDGL